MAILLLASAGAWFIAGRALAPVRQLTDTARSISQSDLTQRVEVRGTGDAAEMARTFNAMLDRLETVFRSQREFVEDTSHELRDPLTICRGHLELLGEDPDEQRQTVALVTDELDRMTRTVDDLQLLADSEHPGLPPARADRPRSLRARADRQGQRARARASGASTARRTGSSSPTGTG